MDPIVLKKKYGDRLCFWGSIDEQHTLPFGTPADVEAEVRTRFETLGRNGGLIVGPTHHVQARYPPRKFLGPGQDGDQEAVILRPPSARTREIGACGFACFVR